MIGLNLLSDSASEHERRNIELGKSEVEGFSVLLSHDIHINKILHVVLVQCNQQLFLQSIKNVSKLLKLDRDLTTN